MVAWSVGWLVLIMDELWAAYSVVCSEHSLEFS